MAKSIFHVIAGLASIPGSPHGNLAITKPVLWTPGTLGAALKAWYRADTNVVTASSRVSSWAPVLSGIGPTLAQATAGNQPKLTTASTSGLAAIVSDAAGQSLFGANTMGLIDTQPLSMVVALQVNNAQRLQNPTICLGGYPSYSGVGLSLFPGNSGVSGVTGPAVTLGDTLTSHSSIITNATAEATGTTVLVGLSYDGSLSAAGMQLYLNGALAPVTNQASAYTAGGFTAAAPGNLFVGCPRNFSAEAQDYIMEVFFTNTVMTAADMAAAYGYFTARFA